MKFKRSEKCSGRGLLSNFHPTNSRETWERWNKTQLLHTNPYKVGSSLWNHSFPRLLEYKTEHVWITVAMFFPWPTFYRDLPCHPLHPKWTEIRYIWKLKGLHVAWADNENKKKYSFFWYFCWFFLNISLFIRVGICSTLRFSLLGNLGRWFPSSQ